MNSKRFTMPKTHRLILSLLTLIAMTFLPNTTLACSQPNNLNTITLELIEVINATRIQHNVPKLNHNRILANSAQNYACVNARRERMSHTGVANDSPGDRLLQAGYDYSYAGENLAMGFVDPQVVLNAWMRSPTHREILLDPRAQDIGIGIALEKTGRWQWTMHTGRMR